jgi:hypothetical protein
LNCERATGRTHELQVVQFLLEMCDVQVDVPVARPCTSGQSPADSPRDVRTTALCAACERARADTVRYLLANGRLDEMTQMHTLCTPLGARHTRQLPSDASAVCAAVAGGSWEIVSMLLSRNGIDVQTERDAFGRPVLAVAARHAQQHVGIVELLLSRGACVCARTFTRVYAQARISTPRIQTLRARHCMKRARQIIQRVWRCCWIAVRDWMRPM